MSVRIAVQPHGRWLYDVTNQGGLAQPPTLACALNDDSGVAQGPPEGRVQPVGRSSAGSRAGSRWGQADLDAIIVSA